MVTPEKTKDIPGAHRNGVCHWTGIEEGGINLVTYREITGIKMVALQTIGDVANGIEVAGIKVKSQGTQHGYGELCTGVCLPYTNLDMQRRQQSGQVVI